MSSQTRALSLWVPSSGDRMDAAIPAIATATSDHKREACPPR